MSPTGKPIESPCLDPTQPVRVDADRHLMRCTERGDQYAERVYAPQRARRPDPGGHRGQPIHERDDHDRTISLTCWREQQ
jgi:hypothetical protein